MATDFYDDYDDATPKRRDHLFIWTVFILLLIGVAFACWIGSFYIFGHPEQARSYRLLLKLKKLEPIRRFEVIAAPQGEFLTAQKLFDKYSTFTPLELDNENAELLRIYVKNYAETKRPVPYVQGRFSVVDAYELKGSDMFTHGTVALMQAEEFPQVMIEHVFPATGSNIVESKRLLTPGYGFPIQRTNDVTAVIHVERMGDGRLLFTLMPLHYPDYGLKGGVGTFGTEPPMDLHIEAGFPVLKADRLQQGLGTLAKLPPKEATSPTASAEDKGPELVRLDTPDVVKQPLTGTVPEVPAATPIPVRPPVAVRPPQPTPSALIAQNRPADLPAPRAVPLDPRPVSPTDAPTTTTPPADVPPAATPPTVSPQGVPLKPFLKSNTLPGPPPENGGSWRTYPAGQLPPGRTVSPTEIGSLADRGDSGERLYLRGNFLVTASGDNKAVLRPQGGETGAKATANVRVIVDFPSGSVLPEEGSTLAREAARGFQVVDVRRSQDGTVNVFVREIAQP